MKASLFINGTLVASDIKVNLPKGWRTKFNGEDHVEVTTALESPEGGILLMVTGKARRP